MKVATNTKPHCLVGKFLLCILLLGACLAPDVVNANNPPHDSPSTSSASTNAADGGAAKTKVDSPSTESSAYSSSIPPAATTTTTTPILSPRKSGFGGHFFGTAVGTLDSFCRNNPYAAAGLICGFKASAADLIAQRRAASASLTASYSLKGNRRHRTASTVAPSPPPPPTPAVAFHMQRNLAFIIYGALYQGMAQEYIYNHIYPAVFGADTRMRTVLSKVAFDLGIQTTLMTLPVAYIIKAITFRYSIREAFRRYWSDIRSQGLLIKYYMLWGPVQCLTFSVVPVHLRVSFIAVVSFFWLIILSTISSKQTEAKRE